MRVTSPGGENCSARTTRRRIQEMGHCRETISGGSPDALLQQELQTFSTADRQQLLTEADIMVHTPPEQGLAMKADLALPWHKMREIRRYTLVHKIHMQCTSYINHMYINLCTSRWLKVSGVVLAGEKRQHALSRELIGDNLVAKAAPMSFPLTGGDEELHMF